MEQSIAVTSCSISTNKVSNPVEQQKAINDSADGENIALNGSVPFLQLLNQQATLLTPASDSVNENTNGLLKQKQLPAMVKQLPGMKGALPDNGGTTGKIDSDFEAKLKNQIGLKESLQGIEKTPLFKNEDSKNNADKLSDQTLRDNNFKILDNQSISGNASNLSAANIADKLGLANMDALQTLSGDMAEKLKNVSKENNIFGDKNNQDISLNSISTINNSIVKTSSIDDNSLGQIINRVVSGIKENASADGSRVKITLSPPSLGTLEMDVTVRNNKVEVIIVANNKDVQQTLNTNLDHLKGSLQNQGLTIDRCDVLMQSNREGYPQNFSQQAFYRDGSEKNSNASKEKYSEELKPIAPVNAQIINSPSLNPDNISIFA
jgi:flagellar hook-length control protein FliK